RNCGNARGFWHERRAGVRRRRAHRADPRLPPGSSSPDPDTNRPCHLALGECDSPPTVSHAAEDLFPPWGRRPRATPLPWKKRDPPLTPGYAATRGRDLYIQRLRLPPGYLWLRGAKQERGGGDLGGGGAGGKLRGLLGQGP